MNKDSINQIPKIDDETDAAVHMEDVIGDASGPSLESDVSDGLEAEIEGELEPLSPEDRETRMETVSEAVDFESEAIMNMEGQDADNPAREGLFARLKNGKIGKTAKAFMLATVLSGAMSFVPTNAEAETRRHGRNQGRAESSQIYKEYRRYLNWRRAEIGWRIETRAQMAVQQKYMELRECGNMIRANAVRINYIEHMYGTKILIAERRGDLGRIDELQAAMDGEVRPLFDEIQMLEANYRRLEHELEMMQLKSALIRGVTRDVIGGMIRGR